MFKKIVFMGTPKFAVPILEIINNSVHEVVAVYSQPAKKAKRGQKIVVSEIEEKSKIYL